MINGSRVLAIIPARGGSKGLADKNILPLCGKPLINWTIEKAKRSSYLDRIIVSTDSPKIARIAMKEGAEAPFLRPSELASDQSPTFDAVKHCLEYLKTTEAQTYDYVVLLEPTSPLREDDDIDRMLESLDAHTQEFDAIVSVGEIDEHPSIVKRIDGLKIVPFYSAIPQTTRRQDNQPAYFPYGVAYIIRTETLLKEKTFYPERTTFFIIKPYQNYEIDDMYGFLCAERIMKHEWRLP